MEKERQKRGKGNEGSAGSGAAVRSAIRGAQAKGYTLAEIASRSNRSVSTITNILSGNIKNPPDDLAPRIRSLKSKRKS